jgi:hypothetical protein
MLNGIENFNGRNFKSWKLKMLAIYEYRGLEKIVLGEEVQGKTDVDAQAESDVKNQEVVMLSKLSVMNEMLPEVQDGNDSFVMWGNLRDTHETSEKNRAFFPKNMQFQLK